MGFGTPLSLVIGLILITGGLSLFFLGNFKPEIKKDSDNVYAILGIIAGILGVISFNKEIVPSLEQLLLAGMCIFLMWENIQKRDPVALPPRREDDRGPRRPYRAEYEEPSYSGNAARFGGNDDRGGRGLPRRDYYDDRSSSGPDRYLGSEEPRGGRDANRSSRRDGDADRSSRRDGGRDSSRDNSWGDESPRSIPERSSRSDRPNSDRPSDRTERSTGERPRRDRDDFGGAPAQRGDENGNVERPRRRRPEAEGGDRPARRRERGGGEDIPSADFVEFTPEQKEKGSSWGPQE